MIERLINVLDHFALSVLPSHKILGIKCHAFANDTAFFVTRKLVNLKKTRKAEIALLKENGINTVVFTEKELHAFEVSLGFATEKTTRARRRKRKV